MGKTGKVQYRGIFFQFNTSKRRKLVTLLTLCHFFFANFAWAAEIVIDGQTATSLATVDHVTDVTTATIRNNTAFNSFSTFNVSSGDVVNLYLPGTTTNLMNLVHSEQSTINGLLNSIKDGQIGGHVFFANPHGVIIGNQGIINVGALSISTPTQSFMDSFFLGAGDPQQESVDMLLDGSVPLNGNGLISVAGELNSIGDITLLGGSVNNSGVIASGASFSGSAPTFSDVVNVNDLQSAAKIEVVGGDIYIRAENAVTVDGGTIAANGVGESNKAGDIDIHAQAVTLSSGAELYSYNDDAQLQAGDVTLAAVDQADHEQIAVIDSTNAAVAITDTTIRAGSIAISADSSMTASAAGTPVDLAVDAAIVDVSSVASVELNDSHLTTETGALTVAATSTVAADTQADASSTSLPVSGDAAVATTIVDSSAVSHIGGDTILNLAQELDLSSNNKVTVNTTADGSTGGDLAAGGSAAVTVVKRSEAKAYIDGNAELINQPDINVTAESLNNIKTVAKSTSKGASENSEGTQDNLDKYGPETTETDDQGSSKVTLAGALAVTDMANANTQAYVDLTTDDDSNVQTGMGALTVSAKSLSNSSANADGSATQGDVGVGVAVAVNIGNENNRAYIGENTDIAATSVDVAATMADYTTSEGDADTASSYLATATSGSGSKNVGVAGALGLNVSVNTTEAAIKTGAQVDAGSGHVNLESNNNTEATVESKASVKNSGGDEPAAVGVGASVGLNVAVNTTTSQISDGTTLTNAGDTAITAASDHTIDTKTEGGASGSKVSVTPLAAVTTAVNTTTAKIGTGNELDVASLNVSASNNSAVTTEAKGQTAGDSIAIGASLGLTTAVDTVTATTERDISASGDVAFSAESNASSSTTATASATGGKKADANGDAEAGGSVDEQIAAQKTASNDAAAAGGDSATDKIAEADSQTEDNEPKAETSEGAVSVAAGIAANVGVNTTEASIGEGRTISSGGKVSLATINQTDTSAVADGSQVDGGSTNVGVGAAVALNLGVATNTAVVKDNSVIDSEGLTLSARTNAAEAEAQTSTSNAKATSGAGAANVGVAGSLGLNVAANTTTATIAGDTDENSSFTTINAGGGNVTLETQNNTEATVESKASVKNSGGDEPAAVGVGASVGLNVAVNTTTSQISDGTTLTNAGDTAITAASDHTIDTKTEGGASGSKVSVTPLAAVTTAVNTTTAKIGTGNELDVASLNVSASNNSAVTTEAKGQTAGDSIAIGASLGLTTAVDTVTATTERDISATGDVAFSAEGNASSSTTATASATGGKKADANGDAEAGGSVDEQIAAQKTASNDAAAAGGDSATDKIAEADSQTEDNEPKAETSEGAVSVAAGIAANVGVNTTEASIGEGRTISSGGKVSLATINQTDTSAVADGSQVDGGSTNVGVGAAVALNVGVATNTAVVKDNSVIDSEGLTLSARTNAAEAEAQTSTSNAKATSGAGAANVGVAGSLGLNVAVNTTTATIAGDTDENGTLTTVDANAGAVTLETQNNTEATVESKASVKNSGGDEPAAVGVGASVGLNVAVNTTTSQISDGTILTNAGDTAITAASDHTIDTKTEGGASGSKVSVTPLAAVTTAVNTTTAKIGTGNELDVASLNVSASNNSAVSTEAKGQTAGDSIAIGASLGLTTAVDTVTATTERDISATGDVAFSAESNASSSTTATASATGGKKADANGDAEAGGSVDEQIAAQKTASNDAAAAGGDSATDKIAEADSQTEDNEPKAETSEGAVSVAAGIAANVGVNTTEASIGEGRTISSGGKVSLATINQTDTSAVADGSQVDGGSTNVGVGAAVALNVGVATNTAVVKDNSVIDSEGLTLSARTNAAEADEQVSTSNAKATSGAGAANVGVAGSLGLNVAVNTTTATIAGDTNEDGTLTAVDANTGAVNLETQNNTEANAEADAVVKMTGDDAAAGVGVSAAFNVAVNNANAEVSDGVTLSDAGSLTLDSTAAHKMTTKASGGASGAKVSVTPLIAVSVAVNKTQARLGSGSATGLNGDLSVSAHQTNEVSTTATGQTSGDVAVGASLAVGVASDNVYASVERDITSSTSIDLQASSKTGIKTVATASAKGATKQTEADGETQKAGTSTDEQVDSQLDFGKGKAGGDADGIEVVSAETPATETPDTDNPEGEGQKSEAKKVSVAAAIGAGVAENKAVAKIADNKTITTSGAVNVAADTDTNYSTLASGAAKSDDVGVGAAVALTVTRNQTIASIGSGTSVQGATDLTVSADSKQNRDEDYLTTMASESVSGASGGDVAVAGSLAVVANFNETRASIGDGADIDASGDVIVSADDTSRIAAQARAGSISLGEDSKAGVGASFAVLYANNDNIAAVGYNTDDMVETTTVDAKSLTVKATKHKIDLSDITLDYLNFSFDTLDPSTYLSTNNYYTEAIAGAAAQGDAAVAGSFSVNVFDNTTAAYIGEKAVVTTSGNQTENDLGETLGVEVASAADIQAVAFSGAVAGAKKAGVGVTLTNITNLDQTTATIDKDAVIRSNGADAGVKVDAAAQQTLLNIGVSGSAATEGSGVSGVVGLITSINATEAQINDGATVSSAGDLNVTAMNDSDTIMFGGGVAAGKSAGVGGTVAVNVNLNKTTAKLGNNTTTDAEQETTVVADADESSVAVVVSGAGGGKAGVAGAFSVNVIKTDTQALIEEGAWVNQNVSGTEDSVLVEARDDTVAVGLTGAGAGGGDAGVGAALDTAVIVKSVKAYVADDNSLRGTDINAAKEVSINADSSEVVTSTTAGFAGGGKAGVGGAVSVAVIANDVQGYIGNDTNVDSDGNVLVNAEDDMVGVMIAGSAAGGGQAGVGGSLAVATLIGSTKAYIGEGATVNARGNRDSATVISGGAEQSGATEAGFDADVDNSISEDDILNEDGTAVAAVQTQEIKGLSVTASNREVLSTTVASGAGGGQAGVAATVNANVIATTAEARIDSGAQINQNNAAASSDQVVQVKALDETVLVNIAGGAAGGGSAGVGAAGNIGVIAKTINAKVGPSTLINAENGFDLSANSTDVAVTGTMGFGGGGSAGVGGAVGALVFANSTTAEVEDGTDATDAAQINVESGDLTVEATEFSSLTTASGAGAGGGSAGVGGSLAVVVNSSNTKARIGNYAETNASGTTAVHASSTENVNSVTVAGAGGGAAGVSGAVGVKVVVSETEAGIGDYAQINQDATFATAEQSVDVNASDTIVSVGLGGAGAGGGAAGVGGTADVTVALNTTTAYIGKNARVDAQNDVNVDASSAKYVNSVTFAGAGGGAAGVAGAFGVISVGSLLDGESSGGMEVTQEVRDADGNPLDAEGNIVEVDEYGMPIDPNDEIAYENVSTQEYADGQTTKSSTVDADGNNMLGSSERSASTAETLDNYASKLAISDSLSEDPNNIPTMNTSAWIDSGAQVNAGHDVSVTAEDKSLAIMFSGAGAGGGAAGVAGSLGVTLLHDSAGAYIADDASVDADGLINIAAETSENVYNVGVTGSGAGAAAVDGAVVVNVVSSDTDAFIGDADINQNTTGDEVSVTANSSSNIATMAGSGGGAGAASVGGVLGTNVLEKDTKAYISSGADVAANDSVSVKASSVENLISGGVSIRGAGAAAVSAVVSANVAANKTQAAIGDDLNDDFDTLGATVDSGGNVDLSATDDTLIVAVSAVGNGAGAAGVGVNVGANVISNQTRAYVADNSTVNARGNAEVMDIYTGTVDVNNTAALPEAPAGQTGDVDVNNDGVADGNINGQADFTVAAEGDDDNEGAESQVNTAVAPKDDPDGEAVATTGMGSKNTQSAKGLSVTAVSNEKVVSTTIGVAGAGAAAVTGSFSSNVITSETEAAIGDNTYINTTLDAGDVNLNAAGNTFMVQVAGTVSGAGAAAVSGSMDTGVIAKKTHATIGEATIYAEDLETKAISSTDLYTVTTNVSVAGAAGVGAAAGVQVVSNETLASVGGTADISATGDLGVTAEEDTDLLITTVAGSGGIAAVSGGVSVAVIDNTTKAFVADGAAQLDAGGTTEISADSKEKIVSVTGSAAGGGVGVAGSVSTQVVSSETVASIGDGAQVNQRNGAGAAQDVIVKAQDVVEIDGAAGTAAIGIAGFGGTADISIVKNTTTAAIGDSAYIDAGRDVLVQADSTKDVSSNTVAASLTGVVGVGGAVSLVSIGSVLDEDSQATINDSDSGESTAAYLDGTISDDKVSGELGDSEHVQSIKTDIAANSSQVGVADDLDASSASDKTQASIGSNAVINAGDDISVSAVDKSKIEIITGGLAVGGVAGVGGAAGIGIKKSTTEAFIAEGAIIDADGDVAVNAETEDVDGDGSKVTAYGAAAGYIGIGAAVAYLDSDNTTTAALADDVSINSADNVNISANEDIDLTANAVGAAGGAGAVGGSYSRAKATGSVTAATGSGVDVGQSGTHAATLTVAATSNDKVYANSLAGAAGIYSGSGAVATATNDSVVSAATGADNTAYLDGDMVVNAEATPQAKAVSGAVAISIVGSVGASIANASVKPTVTATLGANNSITADSLTVSATKNLISAAPSADADAVGASGGLLLGVSATSSTAEDESNVTAKVTEGSTVTTTNVTRVVATSNSKQTADATGLNVGFLAVGANVADANSNTTTHAILGDDVAISGSGLMVQATGTDENYADSVAGSGGVISGQAAIARTATNSTTRAATGSGTENRGIDVATFTVDANHSSNFDSSVNSTNAAIVGASGSYAINRSNADVIAAVGNDGYIAADAISLTAANNVRKNAVLLDADRTWNLKAGSGGAIDAPAATSDTEIVNNADVNVGENAEIYQNSQELPGVFEIRATNDVVAYDKVKLDSGGLISVASAQSIITADQVDAGVQVGQNATLIAVEDLDIQTYATGAINTQTSADAYGVAGAPSGESIAHYEADNSIAVGQNAYLFAKNDINLKAGSANNISVAAQTDLWNKTAFPVSTNPQADAIAAADASINIAVLADIAAAHDVNLWAERGSQSANISGVGKDIYRETAGEVVSGISNLFGGDDVSFDIPVEGEKSTGGTTLVNVDGSASAGVENRKFVRINPDGTFDFDGTSLSEQVAGFELTSISIAGNILARIEKLKNLKSEYAGDATAVAAYESEINFLQYKLLELGLDDPDNPGFAGEAGMSPIDAIEGQITVLDGKVTTLNGEISTLEGQQSVLENNLADVEGEISVANQQLNQIDIEQAGILADIATLDPEDDNYATDLSALTTQFNNLENDKNTLNNTTIPNLRNDRDNINLNLASVNTELETKNGELSTVEAYVVNLNAELVELGTDESNSVVPAGPTAMKLTLPDIVAKVGDVNIKADSLTGSGSFSAEGYAQIEIVNDSRYYLEFNALTIPSDDGGRLLLNNVDISADSSAASTNLIEDLNSIKGLANFSDIVTSANSTHEPEILITSSYDPLAPKPTYDSAGNVLDQNSSEYLYYNGPAPDMTFTGDVSNLRGAFQVDSSAGSIIVDSGVNIHAGTIDISTRNGDIIQSYTDDFRVVGGDPAGLFADSDLEPGSIVANGSIFMAARYLNINGTIQSGMPDWGVRIPSTVVLDNGSGGAWNIAQATADYNAKVAAGTLNPGDELYQITNTTTVFSETIADAEWNQIDVFYNALTGQMEVSGAAVMGGYVNLYGQIINTAWTTDTNPDLGVTDATYMGNAGKIRALDGYGRIKIENDSSLDVVLNVLDTGSGVAGKISITNIKSIGSDNVPLLERTEYTLIDDQINIKTGDLVLQTDGSMDYGSFLENLVDGRSTEYNPQAGLRYSWTTGESEETISYYRYWSRSFFGLSSLTVDSSMDQYKLSGPITLSSEILENGAYLTDGNAGTNGQNNLSSYGYKSEIVSLDTPVKTETDSWSKCDWWLCVTSQYFMEFNVREGSKTVSTHSLAADYPIAIEFIGQNEGIVDVDSIGNVIANGTITNRVGDLSISSAGSITQANENVMLSAENLTLEAATGIGDTNHDLLLNIYDGGVLSAVTTSGDIRITETSGDMIVSSATTTAGTVSLTTEGSLLMDEESSLVMGDYVNLTAENGSIGTEAQAFNVMVGTPTATENVANFGLEALSRDDINIVQQGGGDLYLVAVESQQGDVTIDAGAGQIIDNNSAQYADTRTIEELEALWDEMRLQGQDALDKVDDTVAAYKNSKTQNYKSYWRMRLNDNGTDDPADDSYDPYNPDFEYVLTDAQRTSLTEYYQEQGADVDQKLAEYVQSKTAEYFSLHEEVGALNDSSYSASYSYQVSTEEFDAFVNKVQWSDEQLRLGMTPGMLKEVTDTQIAIEEPNVIGNSITLISGDNIGSTESPVYIAVTDDLTADTPEAEAARLALMTAERADIETVYNANGVDIDGFNITQRDTLDIHMDAANGGFSASSGGYSYIGSEGGINLVNIDAQGDIRIKVADGISVADSSNDVQISGANLILEAADGGIGSADNYMTINLTSAAFDPTLTMRADGDIYILESANDLYVDSIYSRHDLYLETSGSIFDALADSYETNIRSNSISLISGGSIGTFDNYLEIGLNPDGLFSAEAVTGIYVSSYDQPLTIGDVSSIAGDISLSSAYTMNLGLVSTAGDGTVTLVSTGGSIENNRAPGELNIDAAETTLVLNAQGDIGGEQPLETRVETVEMTLAGDGVANLHEQDDLVLGTSHAAAGDINLVAEGNITSSIIGAQVGEIKGLSLEARGGMIQIAEAQVSQQMVAKADNVFLDKVINPDGSGPLHFDVSGNPTAEMVRINALSSAPVVFDRIHTDRLFLNASSDSLTLNNAMITSYGEIRNSQHLVIVDNQNKQLHDADVQLYTGLNPFYLEMFADNKVETDARAINYSQDFIVNDYSSENSLTRIVAKQLQLSERARDVFNGIRFSRLDMSILNIPQNNYFMQENILGLHEDDELTDADDLLIVIEQ